MEIPKELKLGVFYIYALLSAYFYNTLTQYYLA